MKAVFAAPSHQSFKLLKRFRAIFFKLTFGMLLIHPFESRAQLDTAQFIREGGWIEGMDNYIGLRLSMSTDIETYFVDTELLDFDLYPNISTIGRLHFNYRFLSFSLKFAPSFFPQNGDEGLKGETKSFGLGGGLNFKHWFHILSYSRVKGYYLNNSGEVDPDWIDGDPYLQAPDLVVTNFEGITGYSFNSKYSVKSLTTQTERQLKSAGSFIPILGYRYYITDNKDDDAASTQKSDNFEFVLGAGYHYTFVVQEKFYLSLGATPGVGYIFTKLTTRRQGQADQITHSKSPVIRFDGRAALGYNGRAFFVGGLSNLTASSFETEGTTAVNADTRVSYQIFLGFRINAPKKLREKVDVVDKIKKF